MAKSKKTGGLGRGLDAILTDTEDKRIMAA
jgi:hypothetical protein